MRFQRTSSYFGYRPPRKRRRSGCWSFLLLISLVGAVSTLTWSWLGRRLHVLPPQNPAGNPMGAAQAAFGQGDLDAAVSFASAALAVDPENYPALRLLTRSLVYRSYSEYNRGPDRARALRITQDAFERDPNAPEVLAAYAFALSANGQANAAAASARQVLETLPDHAFARTALAAAFSQAGAHEAALRESGRALENAAASRDDQLDALRVLAFAYNSIGNYQQASRTLERALTINDRLLALQFERALYALQVGDYETATVTYYQVMVIDPANVKARFRLCELSSMLREHQAAVDYCGEVTRFAPGWADGWYQLGREHFLNGSFQQAQQYLHQCSVLQLAQNVPIPERRFECWYLQGQAAQINGDCAALIATYNEFRAMALDERIQQTWVYPPEGPPGCTGL